MRLRLVDWTYPLLGAIVLVLALMLMCSGCAGMVGKGAVESPQVPVHVDSPKVDLQPGAVKVGEGGSFTASLGAIWDMLNGLTVDMRSVKDTVSGIQAKVDSQTTQTVTVGKGNGGLQAALAGVGAGVLALGALAVYLNARKGRLPAKLARKVGGLLSKALEESPHDSLVRGTILDLAPKLGVSEAEIRRFRELVGTAPKGG